MNASLCTPQVSKQCIRELLCKQTFHNRSRLELTQNKTTKQIMIDRYVLTKDDHFSNVNQTSKEANSIGNRNDSTELKLTQSCTVNENRTDFFQPSSTRERHSSEGGLMPAMLNSSLEVVSKGGSMELSPVNLKEEKLRSNSDMIVDKPVEGNNKFTSEQKWIAFSLCLAEFTAFLSMSIIAPFFPQVATAKGMRESVSGSVFSIYAIVLVLSSPIFGKLVPILGTKLTYLGGLLLCGLCNICFGLIDKINGEVEFTVACFVIRIFEALGAAAFGTAAGIIICDQFPDDVGKIFGYDEISIGIGISLGPVIGAGLYEVGGYGLPFYVLGGIVVLIIVPFCGYMLRNLEDAKVVTESVSYKKLLLIPHVMVVCIIIVFSSQAHYFIEPILEPHMRQFNFETYKVGILFFSKAMACVISSLFVGWLCDKVKNKYSIMIVGLLLLTVSTFLLDPSDILPMNGSLWLSITSVILLGVTFPVAYIPTFDSILIAAINGGLNDDISTYSAVSGLWLSVFSLGAFTGPLLGGVVVDFYSFSTASSIMTLCTLIAFFVALVSWFNPCMCLGPYSLIKHAREKVSNQSTIWTVPAVSPQ